MFGTLLFDYVRLLRGYFALLVWFAAASRRATVHCDIYHASGATENNNKYFKRGGMRSGRTKLREGCDKMCIHPKT